MSGGGAACLDDIDNGDEGTSNDAHTTNEEVSETTQQQLTVIEETDEENRMRFIKELEFVQCLSNIEYLYFLSQSGYLKDAAFVGYLEYLTYWKQPGYAQFLLYPQGLFFLELLLKKDFREALLSNNSGLLTVLHSQQDFHWRSLNNPPPVAAPSSSSSSSAS